MKTVTTTALALLLAAAVAAPTLGDTAAPANQTSLRQLLENDLAKEVIHKHRDSAQVIPRARHRRQGESGDDGDQSGVPSPW